MLRKCPSCGGTNVRRSAPPTGEVTWRNEVLSPYRCRDCTLQFWVISRKAYIAAVSFVVAIVAAALAVFLMDMWLNPDSAAKQDRRSDGGRPAIVGEAASAPRHDA